MKLLGTLKLAVVRGESDQIDRWVSSWVSEIKYANWKTAQNLLDHFPNVVIADDKSYLFTITDTEIVIRTQMAFSQGIAIITGLSRRL